MTLQVSTQPPRSDWSKATQGESSGQVDQPAILCREVHGSKATRGISAALSSGGGKASSLDMNLYAGYWVAALIALVVLNNALVSIESIDLAVVSAIVKQAAAALAIAMCAVAISRLAWISANGLSYALFFSISITSLVGLTKTLTGSHAGSTNVLLYGLSFYTATLAYHLSSSRLNLGTALLATNPILLATGPIALFIKSQRHRRLARRVSYFLPFTVLGLFLHQVIATPLTATFGLLQKTDLASSLCFAAVFELFVYANFCGLSLVVFGIAGILGYRVPLNFRQPFSATNLIDFWKGWHTSLSAVLKKLFYQPSRQRFGTTTAIFSVYVASAMWHGVTPNFVIWGLFHAVCFVATLQLLRRKIPVLPTVLMVFAIVVGRLIFADADTSRLLDKLMFWDQAPEFSNLRILISGKVSMSLALIIGFVAAEFFLRQHRWFRGRNYKLYRHPVTQIALAALTLAYMSDNMGLNYAVYGQR